MIKCIQIDRERQTADRKRSDIMEKYLVKKAEVEVSTYAKRKGLTSSDIFLSSTNQTTELVKSFTDFDDALKFFNDYVLRVEKDYGMAIRYDLVDILVLEKVTYNEDEEEVDWEIYDFRFADEEIEEDESEEIEEEKEEEEDENE